MEGVGGTNDRFYNPDFHTSEIPITME
jgi:hypothetical protein